MGIFNRKQQLPPFRQKFDIPAIAAGGILEYDENTLRHFRAFLPFTFMFVRNTSAGTIRVRLNRNPNIELEVVSKGEGASSSIWFETFAVFNDGTLSTADSDVTIWVEKIS